MTYRLYVAEDFPHLYAIEELCFQPPQRFSRSYMRSLVNAASAATWIAEDGGKMAGFSIVDWSGEAPERVAYLQTIELAADFRGRGAGRELLHRCEDSARVAGVRDIWLHVDAQNSAAIALYQSAGYNNHGREENYYSRGRAALVFRKELSANEAAG